MTFDLTAFDDLPDYVADVAESAPAPTAKPNAWGEIEIDPDYTGYEAPKQKRKEFMPNQQEIEKLFAFTVHDMADDNLKAKLKADRWLEGFTKKETLSDNDRLNLGSSLAGALFGYEFNHEPSLYWLSQKKEVPVFKSKADAYRGMWDDWAEQNRTSAKEQIAKQQAIQLEKEQISKEIGAFVSGKGVIGTPPLSLLKYADNPDDLAGSLKRARNAFEVFEKKRSSGKLEGFSRSDALELLKVFSKGGSEGGIVADKEAISFFMSAAKERAENSQDESSKFWRNFGAGLTEFAKNYGDVLYKTGQGSEWMDIGGGTIVPIPRSEDEKRELRVFEDNRALLDSLMGAIGEYAALERTTAKTAHWLTKGINGAGSAAGQTAPYFVPSAGWQMAGVSSLGRNMNKSALEGGNDLDALIDMVSEVGQEKLSFAGVGKLSFLNRFVSKVGPARLAAKVPLAAKMEGSFLGRAGMEFGLGTAEELVLEPLAGETFNYAARKALRSAGVDVQDKEFEGLSQVYEGISDPETALGTMIFVGGMVGASSIGIRREAKEYAAEYSRSVQNMKMAGLTAAHAKEVSAIKDIDARLEQCREYLKSDVLNDTEGARERAKLAGREVMDAREAALHRMSGAVDDVLLQSGIGNVEKIPGTDKFRVTYSGRGTDGKSNSVEMTEPQLDAFIQLQFSESEEAAMRDFTSRVFGNAVSRTAEGANDNMTFLDANDVAELKADLDETGEAGMVPHVSYNGMMNLVERTKRTINDLTGKGMDVSDAMEADSVIPGVRNRAIAGLDRSIEQRMKIAGGKDASQFATHGMRFNAMSPVDSVILFAKGNISALHIWEEVEESNLHSWLGEGTEEERSRKMGDLGGHLRAAQEEILKRVPGMKPFIKEEGELTEMDVLEAFSTLAQSDSLTSFESWDCPEWVKDMMRFVVRMLGQAQDLLKLGEAWRMVLEGEGAEAFIQKHGDLVDMLEKAGADTSTLFARARMEAEDAAAARAAMDREAIENEAAEREESPSLSEGAGYPDESGGMSASVISVDDKGSVLDSGTFITKSDGSPDWFVIPKRPGQATMPVRLLVGDDRGEHSGYGLNHIVASRDSDGLWEKVSPAKYLADILEKASELYETAPGRELLVRGKSPSSWMILQLDRQNDYYSIVTAFPVTHGKRPKGKRIPLAERLYDESQRVDRSQRPANPESSTGGLGRGSAVNATLPSQSAGGESAFSLPDGSETVNIKDVTCRFDDGSELMASFSTLSLKEVMEGSLAERVKEQRVNSLLHGANAALERWRVLMAGTKANQKSAAVVYGQIASIMSEIHRTLPEGYRMKMAPYMNTFKVLSKMIENGKLYVFAHLDEKSRAKMVADIEAALDAEMDARSTEILGEVADAVPLKDEVAGKGEKKIKDIYAKHRQDIVSGIAEGKVESALADLLVEVKGQMEVYLKDKCVKATMKRVESLVPKKRPDGKSRKGLLSADGYRQLGEYIDMLKSGQSVVDSRIAFFESQLNEMDKRELTADTDVFSFILNDKEMEMSRSELNDQIASWKTFGNLEGMVLDESRAAMKALLEYAMTEKTAWKTKERMQAWRNEHRASKIARGIKSTQNVSGQSDRDAKNEEISSKTRTMKSFFSSLMSMSQLFESMKSIPGVGRIMEGYIGRLAQANIDLNVREKKHDEDVERMIMDRLGFSSKKEAHKWLLESKRTQATGIDVVPVIKKTIEISYEEAMEWSSLFSLRDKAALRAKQDGIRKKAKEMEIMPERLGLLHDDEADLLREALAKRKTAKTVSIKRDVPDDSGRVVNLRVSKAEAMYMVLLYEQDRYKQNFADEGYTREKMDALYSFVGEDGLKVAYGLRELLGEQGKELATTFERLNGVPFPKEENYFRAVFRNNAKDNARDALFGEGGFAHGGHKYGMLIERVNHHLRLDLSNDVFRVFKAATAETDNYICTRDMVQEWRGMLSYKHFADALTVHLGKSGIDQLRGWIDILDGAGSADAAAYIAHGKVVGGLQGGKAMALLAFNPLTLLKQTSALLHPYVSGRIGLGELVLEIAHLKNGKGHFTLKEMAKRDIFFSRRTSNKIMREIMTYGADQNYSFEKGFALKGMDLIEHMDIWSNAASHTALANSVYRALAADNEVRRENGEAVLTEEEMEELALSEVRASMELGAQPTRRTQKSYMAARGNFLVQMLLFMGSESVNKFGLLLTHAKKGEVMKAIGVFATMSLFEQFIVSLFNALTAPPKDEEEWKEFWLQRAVTTPVSMLGSVPALGSAIEIGLKNLFGMKQYGNYSSSIIDYNQFFRSVKKLYGAASGEKTSREGFEGLLGILQGSAIVGGVFSNSAIKPVSSISGMVISAAAASNIAKTGVKVADGVEKMSEE